MSQKKVNYSDFPIANAPYIAHLVPWEFLSDNDKEDAANRFSATHLIGKDMSDFLYLCSPLGGLIARCLNSYLTPTE